MIKDIHLRQAILKSQKFETIAIGVTQFFHLLANDHMNPEQKQQVNNSLKNLVFFTHQNYLIQIQIMLSRITSPSQNQWSQTLQKITDAKMLKKVRTKGEAVQLIKGHIQNAENILRNLSRQNVKKRFFIMINDWLNLLHSIPNERLRETLYNIEAFRADALNLGLPEPK